MHYTDTQKTSPKCCQILWLLNNWWEHCYLYSSLLFLMLSFFGSTWDRLPNNPEARLTSTATKYAPAKTPGLHWALWQFSFYQPGVRKTALIRYTDTELFWKPRSLYIQHLLDFMQYVLYKQALSSLEGKIIMLTAFWKCFVECCTNYGF